MLMKLSIIVPVYNVEKYLDKCLSSLVNQRGIDDYEIIVVNDGTKDNSQDIIDRYVLNYPNLVRSYIKENGGISSARNFAIKYANGDYITFLDSDDYVEPDYYAGMYNLAIQDDLDLVVADLEYVWEKQDKEPMVKEGLNKAASPDMQRALFLSPLFSWNKLYRRELFISLGCEYPIGLWYEDIPVALRIFANAGKVGYYDKVGVHYIQRDSSIMGSGYSDKMWDIFTIFEGVTSNFKKYDLYNKFHDELEYLYVEHFLVYGAFRFLRTSHYKDLMNKAFEFIKKEFPNYKNNKYVKTLGNKNVLFLHTNNKLTMSFWHWYLTK